MASSIQFLNNYCWFGAGWLYGSIIDEVCGYFSVQEADICDALTRDDSLAQLTGVIDLTDQTIWPYLQAQKLESMILDTADKVQNHGIKFAYVQNPTAEMIIKEAFREILKHALKAGP